MTKCLTYANLIFHDVGNRQATITPYPGIERLQDRYWR